jgi:hypothetical protein
MNGSATVAPWILEETVSIFLETQESEALLLVARYHEADRGLVLGVTQRMAKQPQDRLHRDNQSEEEVLQ